MSNLSLKQKITLLDQAQTLLDEMVQETGNSLPEDQLHICDRLGGTVSELKDIVECLRQKGCLDEEVAEVCGGDQVTLWT